MTQRSSQAARVKAVTSNVRPAFGLFSLWFVLMLALATMIQPARAQTNGQVVQDIAASLNGMRTMGGDFVQFGPNGEKAEGVFALDRPGKIHFRYDSPSKIQIMSDGKSVVIHDRALQTWDLWPLSKTPLRFLLSDKVDFLNDSKVNDIKVEADIVTVTMVEESMFGKGRVTLLFDRASKELRQWTVTDAQGLDTTVTVYNLKGGMDWNKELFKIPYGRIAISERQ
ncbi:outer membrane lipoprotein carrier protein LolA [Pararhizobium sp. IMCC21322]|uniref:LolA family protein n=1 Tax=Pararhizobium sp. IMCC21322 TaxID=3067903 RepID=UPI0027418084|nr:outer membrane lipoprotein carrier protein LolA [Pararhizobium sp. IMCC21322]